MKSQREVEREYNKLLQDVATKDYYKVDLTNRVNCYLCSCGQITKTKDLDAGTTPMFIKCETCGKDARSTFYQDIRPDQEPTYEWYRPALKEVLKLRSKETTLDHVLSGGLLLRKCNLSLTVPR
ncbi:hypothetical protein [Telluribacter humicola]|uniref:hypothetical protein n=1 Tax=Telluribacter humicola TaxID=1720261 RepID=UPI001A97941C|nr:hypothetical protein [Telluribacter humicola]